MTVCAIGKANQISPFFFSFFFFFFFFFIIKIFLLWRGYEEH
jgi:hypothetical protein